MTPSKPPMGINVASDTKAGLRYADMIVDGHKTLESRNSDTLRPYVGKRVAIVRTGEGKAKAIGEVTIGEPKVVNQRQFRAMEDEHRVPKGSRFDINTPTKHLYPMHDPVRYEEERDVGHGIVSRQVIHKAEGGRVQVKRLYHGTNKDFKRFNVGSYLTDDPDYASKHGNIVMPVHMTASKIKQIPDEDFRLMAGRPSSLKPYIDDGYHALSSDAHGDYIILDPSKVKSAITRKSGGGSMEPTVDEMRQALAKKGSKDDYFSVLEERNMSNPRYREYLEKQQGLEGSYPDMELASLGIGALLRQGKNIAKGLFQPKAPMTSAQKDANLASFLAESKAPPTLYHGTDKSFPAFDKKKVNRTGWGEGFHLAEDTSLANMYAGRSTGSNVMPVHASIKNPYVMKSLDEWFDKVPGKTDAQKTAWVKSKGYDGIKYPHSESTANETGMAWVAFEPTQIKSAIGNRGTFNPNKANMNKADGGTIHMAKGGSMKEPKSTVKAYKMFRADPKQPGKLFPLFVDAKTPVPMNKWVDAKEGEMKDGKVKSKIGPLAYRPGWHAGDLPIATHIGDKDNEQKAEIARIKVLRDAMLNDIGNDKEGKKIVNKMYPFPSWVNAPRLRNPRHIWAEVDMPNDVDWQSEATRRGYNDDGNFVANQAHITDQMPKGGHYRYKTNSNMTGNWLIGGSMKVKRILKDEEVQRINEAAGASDLPRIKPMKQEMFGFAHGGSVGGDDTLAPEEFKAEEYVNYKAEGGAVEPTVEQMREALRQKMRHGMYSPLERLAVDIPRNKGTGAEFMNEISKRPGYKAEEVADRKIPIPEGKMTKLEFLRHLREHSLPPLQEQILQDLGNNSQALDDRANDYYGEDFNNLTYDSKQDVKDWVSKNAAKYQQYQLRGGDNYREMLLKLPESKDKADKNYQSNHWKGSPNVLAHLRLSDREGPDGEKLLHVEEIQSDWHQAGRKKGYKPDNYVEQSNKLEDQFSQLGERRFQLLKQAEAMPTHGPEFTNLIDEANSITPKLMQLQEQRDNMQKVINYGVPEAPFKKNWHEMAIKHALHHAAKNGYKGLLITPGAEQADRYGLAGYVDELNWFSHPTGNRVVSMRLSNEQNHDLVVDPSGKIVEQQGINRTPFDGKDLSEVVGQDITKKIFSDKRGNLNQTDMQVGGEGMKGFYDKIVPTYLNKLGKPHGVKVGTMPILKQSFARNETEHRQALQNAGLDESSYLNLPPEERAKFDYKQTGVPLHHFPINDQMRTSILKEGLPQYMRGGIVHKAEGGAVLPIEQIKAQMMNRFKGLNQLQSIGANEAPSMGIKAYVSPVGRPDNNQMPVGGVDTSQGDLPVGGIDMSQQQAGHQLMPNNMLAPSPAGQPQGMDQSPMGDIPPPMGGMPPVGDMPPPMGGSNILQMTPQGQAMAAMKPQGLAKGGSAKSTADMKAELAAKKSIKDGTSTRIKIDAEGPNGVKGIVVPRHMWEGSSGVYSKGDRKGQAFKNEGMRDINVARAKVYGSENRDPLDVGKIGKIHEKTLEEHFSRPLEEQHAAEQEALGRLRKAKHIKNDANTLDKSEKLDTVRHEHDEEGRGHVGFASKGVAGHSLYTSGHGENQKHHVVNTCPGQTEGCGGGKDAKGVVDTSRGTCFAPNAEQQYVNASVRRAAHEQAKHDPAMTKDWILAHTASLRDAARLADKNNQRLLFRPNVVDETDVSSRHVIRHLNQQRKADDKPPIIANSYGKTNELHDPENGYHVTHSNVGPKVKKGTSISENISRDKARVSNTIMAADNKGDFKNEQGKKTPPKGSYMVTDVKRGSPMAKSMEEHITHAKYWSRGNEYLRLSDKEREEGPEGHYDANGKPTTPEKAHYGHVTLKDHTGTPLRFDYQKQHVLHPRLVNVPERKKNKKTGEMQTVDHMIPTDSRFMDTKFLPENRFKTKNGKEAGHILMTTPTESTSNIGHQTSFTHHVSPDHIEHAKKNAGEYEIDKPEDQLKAAGKEYVAPKAVKFYAEGGQVGGRHIGFSDDDFHAFPEQNVVAQRHLAMRGHDHETVAKHDLSDHKRKVTMNKDMDSMLLELTRNKKAK